MSLTEEDKKWLSETFATKDDLRDMETRLVAVFHDWEEPLNAKFSAQRDVLKGIQHTLDAHDAELDELRKRIGPFTNRLIELLTQRVERLEKEKGSKNE